MDEKTSGFIPTENELISTRCPLCGTADHDHVLYPESLSKRTLDGALFSARRNPDKMHFRFVKCGKCDLIRSNPFIKEELISKLYQESQFSYDQETKNLRRTYGAFLKRLDKYPVQKNDLLEIGCGNGFFLEEALDQGFKEVIGIEPGTATKAKATSAIKGRILETTFKPLLFHEQSFDVVCLFQVLDHLSDPNAALNEVWRILRPGGYAVLINHDVKSILARLLGERCPIFDVQHPFLYDRGTQTKILNKNGFKILETVSVSNLYSLAYWLHLFPMSLKIKSVISKLLEISHLSNVAIRLSIGNLGMIATKK